MRRPYYLRINSEKAYIKCVDMFEVRTVTMIATAGLQTIFHIHS